MIEDFEYYEGLIDRLEVLIDRLHKTDVYTNKRRRELYKKLAHKQIRYLRDQLFLLM